MAAAHSGKRSLTLKFMVVIMLLGLTATSAALFPMTEFGKLPQGSRLERIQQSPQYRDGKFHNQSETPMMTDKRGRVAALWDFFFARPDTVKPDSPLPLVKTDLAALDKQQDVVVWLGHSSWFIQLGGKRILIDPVFSHYAAPFAFLNKAFVGDYPWRAEDMPEIDFVIISHDHWDHLDYPTLRALKSKIKQIVTPLGVGAHLEAWGFSPALIHELDWQEKMAIDGELTVHALPARHFSGRGLTGNKTLWASFMLVSPQRKVYYSGDTGYGPHFRQIGEQFSDIDLAIMENGQYDEGWKYIHMMPEEAAQATEELGAKTMVPGHAGRFALANHSWDEPFRRIAAASVGRGYALLTPEMGQIVEVSKQSQVFDSWWE
ncbi:MBL fold metallo-hydrolase [Cedecea sp. FDAARGOS_727]|uniref:MBL fold metallo-hydrolase n=1 Tax=Cedecea sp. FDAARGOS_727 TaxID=2545798 RepID=UPI00143E4360|nr:MBL fold metallo-hydrolase [Cedecea sp. FDAARGOS_727]QIX96510.1 MBL fold metallo-hydrolase [Cedecea sp. FDAARGOS_727]